MNGTELTADDIDAISRTMLEDGTTTLDYVESAGYSTEQTTTDHARLTCSLVEYNGGTASVNGDDYELRFDCGKERYIISGKIVVESERNAVRKLYRDLVANFRWEYAVYAPMDTLRFVCFGDDGTPEEDNAYYYDQEQYVSILDELFAFE